MSDAFTVNRRVQFAETDIAGVLHFSNYFRLMEEAECAFWRSLNLSVITPEGAGHISWPRVATSCDYFAPAFFEDELTLALRLIRLGEKSATFEVDVRRGDVGLARGRMTVVCCATTPGSFAPVPIPPRIRTLLEPLVRKPFEAIRGG